MKSLFYFLVAAGLVVFAVLQAVRWADGVTESWDPRWAHVQPTEEAAPLPPMIPKHEFDYGLTVITAASSVCIPAPQGANHMWDCTDDGPRWRQSDNSRPMTYRGYK